jgi:hypothetical protein
LQRAHPDGILDTNPDHIIIPPIGIIPLPANVFAVKLPVKGLKVILEEVLIFANP